MNAYIDQDCATTNDCAIGSGYGYPIGSWCVTLVNDMSGLFYDGNLDIFYSNFNEDISSWDTSKVWYLGDSF